MCIVVSYPIRYCIYAVSVDRQQQQPRERRGRCTGITIIRIHNSYIIRRTRPACNTLEDTRDYPGRRREGIHVSRTTRSTRSRSRKLEEDGVVVLLSFVWCPLDNTLFMAPTYNTDNDMRWMVVTLSSMFQVILNNQHHRRHPYQHDIII